MGRADITIGHDDAPIRWYRTSEPPIFAGLRINWLDATDPETGAEISLSSGAGMGSKYMTLRVSVPGYDPIYEYVDMAEVLPNRVSTILGEIR